ncbi:MAG: sensor histidine kinase, partial [Burkholderiales bacterium]
RGIDLGTGSRVLVVDGAWRTAFDSQSPAGVRLDADAADPLVQQLAPGVSSPQVVRDARSGRDLVLAFAPAAHGWGVVTLQDGEIAFAARDTLLRQLLLDGALIALFAIAAIVLATTVVLQQRREQANRAQRGALERSQEALARHAERLRIVHEIDRAIIAAEAPQAIAGAVIRPLRELLGVPRAIVNLFDLATGEVEWLAAAGRHRERTGPGVRYSIRLMGDLEALKRGEPQVIDTRALPSGPETAALLASGVKWYMAVPMIAGGELIGALSFGGEQASFPEEQVLIAQEVATQLAIAIAHARLFERVKRNAEELEIRVRERTAALEALNRELDDLYNNTPCGYHSVGANGLFVRMNQTELNWLGYTRDEVIGKLGPADLHTPASLEIFRKRFETFRKTGVAKDVEYEFRRKDGTVLPVVLNATAVRDRDGKFLMSRSTIFDNTDRKRAAEQLEAANKELESFSYSVSHDLRSPLRAIDGFSRILLEDYAATLDAEGRRLLGVIRDNSRKMGELIDDLLEYSRLGRKPLANAAIDMKRLVDEVLAALPASGGSAPRLELGELPPARGDRTLLKQAWANLLANAVKFSSKREQPLIAVSGREDGAQCVYCVKDNGAGFDMRYHDELFSVFQRLHGADEFEGTGVGLAIVQRVIARHGGRVWAEGAVDAGAAFHFSLPKGGPDGQV